MLNKKELNLISNKQPSPAVCRILDNKQFCVDFSDERKNAKKYLVMWVYKKAATSPVLLWKVFFRKTKRSFEWLSYNTETEKWYESPLSYLFYNSESDWRHHIFSWYAIHTNGSAHLGATNSRFALKYFGIEDENDSCFDKIDSLQKDIREKICKEKAHKKQQPINVLMDKVPSIPKGFSKWVNDTVLFESRYGIYTPSSKKQKNCVCTHCNTNFLIDKGIKTNTTRVCPKCKSTLIFKSSGRVNVNDETYCTLVQKLKGTRQLVIRHFTVYKNYRKDSFLDIAPSYYEVARDIYNPELKKFEEYQIRYGVKHFENTPIWRRGRLAGNYWSKPLVQEGRNYTRNLDSVIKNTDFQYCGIQHFPALFKYDVDIFFENYIKEPWREYLINSKLYNLAVYKHENVKFDFSEKALNEKLKVSSAYFKKCVEYDVMWYGLEFFQILSHSSIPYDHPLLTVANITDEYALLYTIGKSSACKKLCELFRFCTKNNISPIACMNYLYDEFCKSEQDNLYLHISDYIDYLKNVLLVEHSISSRRLKPRNFKKAHDNFTDLVIIINNKKYDAGIQQQCKLLSDTFEMEFKSLYFKMPTSLHDFIAEGRALTHCVATASYGKNHANGKSFIIFVRDLKNKDKPLYTLEISKNGVFKQCRGFDNYSCPDDVMKIVKSYVATIEKKLLNKDFKKTQHTMKVAV